MSDSNSQSRPSPGDMHGQQSIRRNVMWSWGAQLIQIVSGFWVPRLIDQNLSREALGVWDFAWSLVVYFGLIQMGITSSINRTVAFHRSLGAYEEINKAISSVGMVMRAMGGVVLLLAGVISWGVGPWFGHRLGSYIDTAQWIILLLGLNVAIQISATVYASVLTGCHEWRRHSGIQAGVNCVNVIGMVAALWSGGGLIALAGITLAAETMGRLLRMQAARQVCPWLEISWQHFSKTKAREMMVFGGKTFLTQVSQLVSNATVGVLIAGFLGPAVLAVYARPMSLSRNLGVFINKYAMVFSPVISSLHGAKDRGGARALTLSATRGGLHIALPVLILLLVHGDEILRLWMGGQYADASLIRLVVAGMFWQVSYIPLFKALVGFNLHGRPGIYNVVSACVAVGGAYFALAFTTWGIYGVAASVAIASTICNGVFLPVYACRKLEVAGRTFLMEVWLRALLAVTPYTVALIAFDQCLGNPAGFWWGLTVAATLLLFSYKWYVIPAVGRSREGRRRESQQSGPSTPVFDQPR